MSLLGNPVPTSGEIRAMRRRLDQHLAPWSSNADLDVAVVITPGDLPGDASGGLVRLIPNPQQRIRQLLTEPRLRRLLHAAAAAGRAGLDTLEQVSDDTHDTVEENLARLTGLPRAMVDIARPGSVKPTLRLGTLWILPSNMRSSHPGVTHPGQSSDVAPPGTADVSV